MRAVLCHAWCEPAELTIEEVANPEPDRGEVLIAVRACGVNYADTLMIAGQYQFRPDFPFSPGMEMAGEVLAVGDGVDHIGVGARVMGVKYTGGFAEQAVLPVEAVMEIPAGMGFEEAAAFPSTFGTPHVALWRRADLQAGERLLVLGAAGGVGLAAVQVGAAMGAEVIAGASTAEKLALAKKHGATTGINYREESLRGRVREITGGDGVDVIFDPVGGDLFKQAMRCVAWEGRLLIVGFASGEIPEVSVNRPLIQNYSLVGVEWGTYLRNEPETVAESLGMLLDWWAAGKIAPHVSATYGLEDVPEVLQMMLDRKAKGRVVIAPGKHL